MNTVYHPSQLCGSYMPYCDTMYAPTAIPVSMGAGYFGAKIPAVHPVPFTAEWCSTHVIDFARAPPVAPSRKKHARSSRFTDHPVCQPELDLYTSPPRFHRHTTSSSDSGDSESLNNKYPPSVTGGRKVCQFYVRTKTCAFGPTCCYFHPDDVEAPELNPAGYPIRKGTKVCSHYNKWGWCLFAATCKFHHPWPLPSTRRSSSNKMKSAPAATRQIPRLPLMVPATGDYTWAPTAIPSQGWYSPTTIMMAPATIPAHPQQFMQPSYMLPPAPLVPQEKDYGQFVATAREESYTQLSQEYNNFSDDGETHTSVNAYRNEVPCAC